LFASASVNPVKADIVVPTCKPYQDDGRMVDKLLNDPDFSLLKQWGEYKFKSVGCTVNSGDWVLIAGYYRTPANLSGYSIKYLVGFDNQPLVSTSSLEVKMGDKQIAPSGIHALISEVEKLPRVREYIEKFGADDAYITNMYVIYRNRDSNYDVGCQPFCGVGLEVPRPELNISYSLPLNQNYQNFPEIKTGMEEIKSRIKSGCQIDINKNVIVNGGWDYTFPVTSGSCKLDYRGQDIALATYQPVSMDDKTKWERHWEDRYEYQMNPPRISPSQVQPSLFSRIISSLQSFVRRIWNK
jgi:hypothetical protein